MIRRLPIVILLAALVLVGVGCKDKNVKNPLAQVDSKQPDKVLYDRAMEALKSHKFDVARLSLQTLINTYPDSEYIARAKLAVGDSWFLEGGSAAWAQAENEYKDFQTFFPNMAEAAEAQLKIADIHYRQMEKPDRDYTHAVRAEEEFRQLILQYPDSKLVPQAKVKLLEVQEVLAAREFTIGKFYFMREVWPASIARLKSMTDTYPLYSQADEALMMEGQAYENETRMVRASKLGDKTKNMMIRENEDHAAEAYSKIITRYPMSPRAGDAKAALQALDRPIPKPTEDAIAQNKKEIASRGEVGKVGRTWANFKKRPEVSVAEATKVGEPTLVDPKQTDASSLVRQATEKMTKSIMDERNGAVSVEKVAPGAKVPESQQTPRSDSGTATDKAAEPPSQVNEASGSSASATVVQGDGTAKPADSAAPADSTKAADAPKTDEPTSSSSKKKKKGIRKIIPF